MALYGFVFAMGAVSLVVQSVLVRELLAMVHGTELVLGFLFSSWFLWIAVGAVLGARLATRVRRVQVHLALWAGLGTAASLAEVEVLRHAERWAALAQGVALSWQGTWLLCITALAPFCLAVGATFPLAVRFSSRTSEAPGVGTVPIARLYMVEAAGAMVGGMLFAFVLVGRTRHLAILGGCTAFVILAASFVGKGRARAIGVVASLALVAMLPWLSGWDVKSRTEQIGARMPGHDVIAVFDTPYEQIAVGEMADQYTVFANGGPIATVPDHYETPALVYSLLAQQPRPERILVIGNPESGLADELVSALQAEQAAGIAIAKDSEALGKETAITFVHPDEQLIRGLQQKLGATEHGRHPQAGRSLEPRIVFEDPRAFLRTCREKFDLIFVDAPEPTSAQINRLYTEEFYADVARALEPSGVLAVKAPGGSVYSGSDVAAIVMSIRGALETAFAHVVGTAGDVRLLFASATTASLTRDPVAIGERLQGYLGASPYARGIRMGYEPLRMRRLEDLQRRSRDVITNSDHHPSSYYYGSVVWERVSSRGTPSESWLTRAMGAVRGSHTREVGGLVVLMLLVWYVWLKRAAQPMAGPIAYGLAMFTAGFAAIVDEMALLLEYQSACGAIYQKLAVMSGLFMLGTAVAGAAVDYWLSRHDDCGSSNATQSRRGMWTTLAALSASAAFSVLVSPLIRTMGRLTPTVEEIAYGLLFLAAGAVLGATVPAVARALTESWARSTASSARLGASHAAPEPRAAGLLSTMDHLGAMVGALTVGTLVLPAVGTRSTLEAVVVATTVAACAVFMSSSARNARETYRE